MTTSALKPRLGRGLDALLPRALATENSQPPSKLPIESLQPNRNQPRRHFANDPLEELAQSIRQVGVLEPILVRALANGRYEIVAGERRWRAAQKAGLREVPVFVHSFDEQKTFEAALIENLQREDLNPIEIAEAFARLLREHAHTQESLAQLTGKDRSTVANALRLLKLPEDLLEMVRTAQLSEGHARALLTVVDAASMRQLAEQAAKRQWSVRETERQARSVAKVENGKKTTAQIASIKPSKNGKSANVRDLESKLSHQLGAKVTVEDQAGKGYIALHYGDYDQLDGLLSHLLPS